MQILLAQWVSPFGYSRIKACCQLPETFRRLPRPSSPLTAKASTVDAYSLDHITRSRLQVTNQHSIFRLFASTTHLNWIKVQTLVTSQIVKERSQASTPDRFKFFSCTQTYPVLVGLGGLEPPTSPLSGARSNHLSYRPKDFLRSPHKDVRS